MLHDGENIHTIAHFGRRYPAVLRTALMLGAPPEFEGPICSEPGCDRRHHIERDHIDPCANGGKTSYANLASPCWPHHQIKTERDRGAGLLRGKPRGPD
ncbi:MAG: HNH endonuclease signature motif containing protein [Acidimicrobiia bacterium]